MLSTIAFIAVLSILVLIHELGHFVVARLFRIKVERFSIGFGPRIFGVKRGDTEYAVSLFPLGGYVKLAGDEPRPDAGKGPNAPVYEAHEFLGRPVGVRSAVLIAGPILNYILAFLLFSCIYMVGSPTRTTEVGGLLPDYPAIAAGIKPGDVIVAADGVKVGYWEDLTAIISKKTSGPLALSLRRGSDDLTLNVTPIVKERKDIFGATAKMAYLGIMPSERMEKVRYGFFKAFLMGGERLRQLTVMTYKALWSVVAGSLSLKDSMTGPIGIFIITGKAAHLGLIYIVYLMAVLSASLAIFNLLPIPVLDGGHLLFLAIEKLRGKPLDVKVQDVIANIGITGLVALMVYVVYADVVRFQLFETVARLVKR